MCYALIIHMDTYYTFDMACETNIIIAQEFTISGTLGNATALLVPHLRWGKELFHLAKGVRFDVYLFTFSIVQAYSSI